MITVSNAVNKRLRDLLEKRGISAYKFRVNTDMSKSTIRAIMRSENANVNLKTVCKLFVVWV